MDVGVVEKRGLNQKGKQTRTYLKIDFIAKLGSKRYYIQYAYRRQTNVGDLTIGQKEIYTIFEMERIWSYVWDKTSSDI